MRESDDEQAIRTACAEFADITEEDWRVFFAQLRVKELSYLHITTETLTNTGQPSTDEP
jgi:hypothetical protein